MTEKVKVQIYTDGACSGNPGPGGYGTVLIYIDSKGEKHEKQLSCGYRNVTNNQMELMAVIVGLEALKKPAEVQITSDSKYVVDAFNNNWIEKWVKNDWKTADKKPVKNKELWERLLKASEPHDIKYIWIKGHAGHYYNEICDQLAVSAYQSKDLKESI